MKKTSIPPSQGFWVYRQLSLRPAPPFIKLQHFFLTLSGCTGPSLAKKKTSQETKTSKGKCGGEIYCVSFTRLQARSNFALTPLEHNLILLRTLVQFIFQSQEQTLHILLDSCGWPETSWHFLWFFFGLFFKKHFLKKFSLSTSCCEKLPNIAASHCHDSGDQSDMHCLYKKLVLG